MAGGGSRPAGLRGAAVGGGGGEEEGGRWTAAMAISGPLRPRRCDFPAAAERRTFYDMGHYGPKEWFGPRKKRC